MQENTINFTHHRHDNCGDKSDFFTSVMWRNLKLLDMWRNFRILHTCHVENLEITPLVENFHIFLYLSWGET